MGESHSYSSATLVYLDNLLIVLTLSHLSIHPWNKENTYETNKKHIDLVWVTQDVPNTQLSLIIMKQLQYEHHLLGLQLGQRHMTHLTSPSHSYIDLLHRDSSILTNFTSPMEHPKCASTTDSPSLLCHKTLHIPTISSQSFLTQTCNKTSPIIIAKQGFPKYVHRITSRKQKPSHVDWLRFFMKLTSFLPIRPHNHKDDIDLLIVKICLTWLCTPFLLYGFQRSPLWTLMSFRCVRHVCEPSRPNESPCPFVDSVMQINLCTY
jgi:hypothetical protein